MMEQQTKSSQPMDNDNYPGRICEMEVGDEQECLQ